MSTLAAIYARVSTSDQADRGESLPSQIEHCRAYAERLGYQVAEVFSEDISGGTRFIERPAGRRLDAMIQAGQVGAVIIFAVDRFSRRTGDAIVTVEDWLERGAEIHMLDVGRIEDANDIVFVIKGWQGTDEKKKIRERTMRGRRHAIEGGRVVGNGPAAFGYRFDGKKKDTRLVIVEGEAATVRQIFEWYTRGDGDGEPLGVTQIVSRLTATGAQARKGARWSPGTVYPILKRETYAGTWQGYHYRTGKRAGKNWRRQRPAAERVGVPCPSIVDRAMWQAAQDRLNGGRHEGRTTAIHEYLLAGLLKCSCGYHAGGQPCWAKGKLYTYYRCNGAVSKTNTARDCDMPSFRVATWDNIVWDFVHDLMQHPEKMTKGMRAEQATRRRKAARLLANQARVNADIAKYDAEIENLDRMLYKGQCDDAFHDREKAIVEKSKAEALAERATLGEDLAGATLTDEHIATIEQFCGEVAEGLAGATFADKRHYLAWLEVSARLAVEDGEKVMYVTVKVMGNREHRLSEVSATSTYCPDWPKPLYVSARLTERGYELLGVSTVAA
jgi:site-specific DNA recombinase